MGVRRILRWALGLAVLAVGSLAAYTWLGLPSRAEVSRPLARTGADADALE